jgi:hypothetical protein
MDDAERLAWDDAVERATCLNGPAKVEVPADVLIAVDAEFHPSSDAVPIGRFAVVACFGFALGVLATFAVLYLEGGLR